jgi:hypothetical protein
MNNVATNNESEVAHTIANPRMNEPVTSFTRPTKTGAMKLAAFPTVKIAAQMAPARSGDDPGSSIGSVNSAGSYAH